MISSGRERGETSYGMTSKTTLIHTKKKYQKTSRLHGGPPGLLTNVLLLGTTVHQTVYVWLQELCPIKQWRLRTLLAAKTWKKCGKCVRAFASLYDMENQTDITILEHLMLTKGPTTYEE